MGCKTRKTLLVLAVVLFTRLNWGAEIPPAAGTNAATSKGMNSGTNSADLSAVGLPDALRSYLLVQEQLRNTQLAIEQSRQEAAAAAAHSAELLEARLAVFEKSLASQRLDELKEMQTSNRMILNAAGIFASIAFVVLLFTGFLHWSAVNRLAAMAAALPSAVPALGSGQRPPALGTGDFAPAGKGPLEESTQRFLGAIDRLEKRIHEMQQSVRTSGPASETVSGSGSGNGNGHHATAAAAAFAPHFHEHSGAVGALLGKGETMLKLDQAEGALAAFEDALAIEPSNAEALVRKGLALERLQRLDEAIACYDAAIAADSSLTMAYLYKGGVFNRMERFNEALECYEKALKAQEKTPLPDLVAN